MKITVNIAATKKRLQIPSELEAAKRDVAILKKIGLKVPTQDEAQKAPQQAAADKQLKLEQTRASKLKSSRNLIMRQRVR